MEQGFSAPLRSTWPPMTDSAWTSAFTGVNPGRHGIFGSWYRAPGAYACRYFSARDRSAPALWELADAVRFLVWNVPMTYPPAPVDGVMVAGYGAPPGSRFCEPSSIQEELAARWDLDDLLDRAPRSSLDAFLDELVRGLRAQAEALVWLGERDDADCVVAVWPQVDRAQHFLWGSSSGGPAEAIGRVYDAIDDATRTVVEAWPNADVVVVSDHGAGPLHGDVDLGAWLVGRGHAVSRPERSRPLLDLVWALPPQVRRAGRRLAPRLARRAFGSTLTGQLGAFDWARTRAFLGFQGDLWVNLRGREPLGCVDEDDADALLAELDSELAELRDPRTGERVIAATHRRDEVYSGPHSGLAPDVMVDAWSAGYRVAPRRAAYGAVVVPPAPLAGVPAAWSSDHRPVGVFVAAGPRIARGRAEELSLVDVCPTVLGLLERAVPGDLDGRPVVEAIEPRWLERHPVATGDTTRARPTSGDYSADEADAVAAHLRDLGYID